MSARESGLIDVTCDADDCRNNIAGKCSTNIHIKRGVCQRYIINMEYLREKWKYIQGKESVPSRASIPANKKGELE